MKIFNLDQPINPHLFIKQALIIVLLGLGNALTAIAQTPPGDSPQRIEKQRADLSGAPNMEVITSISEYPPGESVRLHSHHGLEALYVIQGASIQKPGREPNMLPTGATGLNLRDAMHAGFTVVGDTPLKLFTVHIVDKGAPLYVYPKQ